jgi:hypothetical protein
MSTHWTDKRASVALVGSALRERGWTLFGWKDDDSDSRTDYYNPQHWDGVAEHPSGAVCCGDVSRYTVESCSGGRKRLAHEPDPANRCPNCNGKRIEIGAPTYGELREQGGIVSPIPYFHMNPMSPDESAAENLRGQKKCHACGGRGHMLKPVESFEVWPKFRQNPPNCSWHVERGGRIIAQGTGVYSIREINSHHELQAREQNRKLEKLLVRIDAAARAVEHADSLQPGKSGGEGVTLRPGTREGFVEVRFERKPPEEIRSELKRSGFRWAKRSQCWYGPSPRLPERYGQAPGQGHAPDIDVAAGY